MKAYYLAIFTK